MGQFQFEHDVAVVSVMKNEGNYIKEWLEYHIAAGITKFYLYDNESEDDFKALVHPYIGKGIVEYNFFPGKRPQMPAFCDALSRYRFDCKYMAFIDADEFILPMEGKSIPDTLHDILEQDPNAGGISVNWRLFGSSGQEKMDISRGVLERFLYRGKDNDETVKCIVNPRCVGFFQSPHEAGYYFGKYSIDENGNKIFVGTNEKKVSEKICINHYHTKSKEEWMRKKSQSDVYFATSPYVNHDGSIDMESFNYHDQNEVYDDGILRYLETRKKNFTKDKRDLGNREKRILGWLNKIEEFSETEESVLTMEEFLCFWHVCHGPMKEYLNEKTVSYFENLLLQGMGKVFGNPMSVWEGQLFLSMIPNLAQASEETRKNILEYASRIVLQLIEIYRNFGDYREYCWLAERKRWIEAL